MRKTAAVSVVLWLCCAGFGRAADAQAKFLAKVFSSVPPEQQLTLCREDAAEAGRIRSGRYTTVPYWRAGDTSVWILQTRAKTGTIKSVFAVRQGRIVASDVLLFQEYLGRQVCSDGFLKQFFGIGLQSDRHLDREIDGITGATLTVGAMRDMARLALFFDSLLVAPPD